MKLINVSFVGARPAAFVGVDLARSTSPTNVGVEMRDHDALLLFRHSQSDQPIQLEVALTSDFAGMSNSLCGAASALFRKANANFS